MRSIESHSSSAPDTRSAVRPVHAALERLRIGALTQLRAVGVALACVTSAFAQQPQQPPSIDPPDRAFALGWREGAVSLLANGDTAWSDAPVGRPLAAGDRLWVPVGSRAELLLGAATVRLAGGTAIDLAAIGDRDARFTLNQGSAAVRAFAATHADDADRIEIGTANLALVLDGAGEARLDVDPASGTTRVAVRAGRATLYGQNGAAIVLGTGGEAAFAGRDLASAPLALRGGDEFDGWVAARNRAEDQAQAQAPRFLPRSVVGWQQLEGHGDWRVEPGYGEVWYPRTVAADWAPYRYGHWHWIAPWGWSWVDDAPWGFAPSHYGRWATVGGRWGWVPGRYTHRPVYSPAVVAFIGAGGARNDRWRIGLSDGGPGVAWIPLAPGEAWRPHFRHSDAYIARANQTLGAADRFRIRGEHGPHTYQRMPGAITAVPEADFGRGRPFGPGRFHRVAPDDLARAAAAGAPPPLTRAAYEALTRPAGPRGLPSEGSPPRSMAVESRGPGAGAAPVAPAGGPSWTSSPAGSVAPALAIDSPMNQPMNPRAPMAANERPFGRPADRVLDRPLDRPLDRTGEWVLPSARPPVALGAPPPTMRTESPPAPPFGRPSFEDRRGPRPRLEDAPTMVSPPPAPRGFVTPASPAPAAMPSQVIPMPTLTPRPTPPLNEVWRGAPPPRAMDAAPQRHPMLRPPVTQAAPIQGAQPAAPMAPGGLRDPGNLRRFKTDGEHGPNNRFQN